MDNITLLSQLYGKGLDTVQKLQQAGIGNAEAVIENSAEELSRIAEISLAQARNLWSAAAEMAEGKEKNLSPRMAGGKGRMLKKKPEKMKRPAPQRGKSRETGALEESSPLTAEQGVTLEEAETISFSSKRPRADQKSSNGLESFWRFG